MKNKIISYQFIRYQETGFVSYINQIKQNNGVFCIDFEDSVSSINSIESITLKKINRENFIDLILRYQEEIDFHSLGVRINPLYSSHFNEDIKSLKKISKPINCIFIPKISNIEVLQEIFRKLEDINCCEIIPIIETKEGFDNLKLITLFKHKRFKKIAFGHCDFNLSMKKFPFIHQTDNEYWNWINYFADSISKTNLIFINSPFLHLNDLELFNSILSKLLDIFKKVGQITLCIGQTEACAKLNQFENVDFNSKNNALDSSFHIAKTIKLLYEKNKINEKSFAIIKGKKILISPHEYFSAKRFLHEHTD